MRPRFTTTAPTGGFGLVLPTPRAASARARAMKRSSDSRWLGDNGELMFDPAGRPALRRSGGLATVSGVDGGLRRGQFGDGYAIGRATHVIETERIAEHHGRGIASMLAANAELDIRPSRPASLDRQPHQS